MASVASASARVEPIKVLVTDNTPMGADLLARTLKRDRRFHVVGTIVAPEEILAAARREQPDLVILTHLDNDSPIRFHTARELRASLPNQKVVIILDTSERSLVVEAFRAGAKGILCRSASVKLLGKCLESVFEGQIWASSAEMQFIVDALVESPPIRVADSKGTPILTNQEQAVVHWMTEGLSNREIAAQLNLSEHTVKNYIFRIFDKLGVSKRVEVILYALNKRGAMKDGANGRAESAAEERLVFDWARTQAETGSSAGAFLLGLMYRDGRGATSDPIAAYAWFVAAQLSPSEFREPSRTACEQLGKRMTHDDIMAALSRIAELRGVRVADAQTVTTSSAGVAEPAAAMAVAAAGAGGTSTILPVDVTLNELDAAAHGNGNTEKVPDDIRENN
jgi:DNA-binding NarL/FixJ family response regulator